uniref:Uncharacterized protein n=1 Tax=Arundo donax TaxID=35708 RepID=A0A0A9DRI3_ARUDO
MLSIGRSSRALLKVFEIDIQHATQFVVSLPYV